jgi:hypothetical protein
MSRQRRPTCASARSSRPVMGSAVEIVGDTGALLQFRAQIDRAPKDEGLIALTLLTPLTLVAPAARRVSGVSGVRGIVGRGEQGTKLGSLRRHPPHEPRAGAHGHRHVAGAGVAPPVRTRPRGHGGLLGTRCVRGFLFGAKKAATFPTRGASGLLSLYSPECVEGESRELRLGGVPRSPRCTGPSPPTCGRPCACRARSSA